MGSLRLWLFRILVAVASGLMVISFINPWWTADTIHYSVSLTDAIKIYSYGLNHSLVEYAEHVASDITPFYQTVLAWVYLAVSVGLILFSTWLKGRKGRWLLGGAGLIFIAYAAIAAFVVIAGRLADLGISLQGWSTIDIEVEAQQQVVDVFSNLRFGYYLAYAAGAMCIALALLRNKIVGKPELGA